MYTVQWEIIEGGKFLWFSWIKVNAMKNCITYNYAVWYRVAILQKFTLGNLRKIYPLQIHTVQL